MQVVDIDYLETLPVRERIPSLLSKYKQEIVETKDWFYKFEDYEINICDYNEIGIFSVVACPINPDTEMADWGKEVVLQAINLRKEN